MPSLFSNGQASTMGLTKTSMRPLPIAYRTTAIRIPVNGAGNTSGRIASKARPAADKTWEATTQMRYPILSASFVAARSMSNCVK